MCTYVAKSGLSIYNLNMATKPTVPTKGIDTLSRKLITARSIARDHKGYNCFLLLYRRRILRY